MKRLLFGALICISANAFAGGEDIYPDAFIEDCEFVSVDANLNTKILEFSGIDVDKAKAGKNYSAMCSCLADKFFSRSFSDLPEAYKVYINTVEFNGRNYRDGLVRVKALQDINSCSLSADKERVKKGIERFDAEQKSVLKADLQDLFMRDIRSSLGKGENEGYLRKADYLSKCYSDKVDAYRVSNPSLVPGIIPRVRQNLQAGTFVNVPVTEANRDVENAVLRIEDNCW